MIFPSKSQQPNVLQRRVKIVTEQHIIDKPSNVEGYPMREWSIRLLLVDDDDHEHDAGVFHKVSYKLHPSFEKPLQTFYKAPFICANEGWGEFEMEIDLFTTEKGKITIGHDLNFSSERYEVIRKITFKNPSQALQERLRESGGLPSDPPANGKKKAMAPAVMPIGMEGIAPLSNGTSGIGSSSGGVGSGGGGGGRRLQIKYDYEKIAEALESLEEDDLLRVVQIINDGRSADTYIKSDVDAGEFSIDLYTMPDTLTKQLWEHLAEMGLVN